MTISICSFELSQLPINLYLFYNERMEQIVV